MSNEKQEKHIERTPQDSEHQVAGKPILSGDDNAAQQRLEKQTAARAHRFTKGDNVFTIDMGNGQTVEDSRPREHDKQLLAQNAVERGTTLTGEISTEVNQVIAPGHSVKFTARADGGITYETAGQWDAASWNQQIKALNKYFTAHPEAVNTIVSESKKHKGGVILGSSLETADSNEPPKHSPIESQRPEGDQAQHRQTHSTNERTTLSGEVSNDLNDLIAPGHAVKFTRRPDGGVNWQPAGHWNAAEWNAQLKALKDYFTAYPEKINTLAAEIKNHRGPLTLGIEANEPTTEPPTRPHPSEGNDRNQWLVGSGSINGHPVQIGGPNDVKIPAAAGANTPVVLSTLDGSGETIHGHIVVQNGQKFFYPDYSEDSQHRCYGIQNAKDNMILLTNAGVAAYEPYKRQ
ncbi:MAG TPA: hypothetical protein V6C86_04005 [Oculatellaceae cyanobacterium]